MRAFIPLIILLVTSCASYTIQNGYDAIVLPDESGEKIETRYAAIEAQNGQIVALEE